MYIIINLAKDLPDIKKATKMLKGKGKGKDKAQEVSSNNYNKAIKVQKNYIKGILYKLINTITKKP